MSNERGAVAVVTGLLMVAIMGFAAVSVDVANMWSDQRQLQNGADAGALAIALDCAGGACGSPPTTADELAVQNKEDSAAGGAVVNLDTAAGTVTVETSGTTEHWFAPVLGADATDLTAQATATWGVAGSGTSSLPLTFSLCEIAGLSDGAFKENPTGSGNWELVSPTGTIVTIYLAHPGNPSAKEDPCTDTPSGAEIPGGFSWIDDGLSSCSAYTTIGEAIGSDPGNPGPSACTAAYLTSLIGKEVVLPVFGAATPPPGASYTIYGYVGFTITGLYLQASAAGPVSAGSTSGCNPGNGQCLRGYFSEIADATGTPSTTAPSLGASTVKLTE